MKIIRPVMYFAMLVFVLAFLGCKTQTEHSTSSDTRQEDYYEEYLPEQDTISTQTVLAALPVVDHTVIKMVPTMETSFQQINAVHCSNIQYLWDAMMQGSDINVMNDLAKQLDASKTWQHSLDTSKLILAFGPPEETYQSILQQYRKKYNIERPDLSPEGDTFWGYTDKLIAFKYAEPFDEQPLQFLGTDISAFGLTSSSPDYVKDHFKSQFEILYFDYDGEFVVQLKASDSKDKIILAMLNNAGTFLEMFKHAEKLIEKGAKMKKEKPYTFNLNREDELVIPVIRFKTNHSYDVLKGLKFSPRYGAIASIDQLIAFNFDRKGVIMESTAAAADSVGMPQRPKLLHFNKPFYLFIKEAEANYPYFNLWVSDTKILERK